MEVWTAPCNCNKPARIAFSVNNYAFKRPLIVYMYWLCRDSRRA